MSLLQNGLQLVEELEVLQEISMVDSTAYYNILLVLVLVNQNNIANT